MPASRRIRVGLCSSPCDACSISCSSASSKPSDSPPPASSTARRSSRRRASRSSSERDVSDSSAMAAQYPLSARSERTMWLVGAARRTDRDEREAIGPGDGLAARVRIEAQHAPLPDRDLVAVDPVDARTGDDDHDLLLAALALVVLVARGAGWDVEAIEAERLEAELAADETDSAARTGGFDVIDRDDVKGSPGAHGKKTSAASKKRWSRSFGSCSASASGTSTISVARSATITPKCPAFTASIAPTPKRVASTR